MTRRPLHLGSWTILADVAGQISESPANAVATVAAVVVADDVRAQLRRRLVKRFAGHPVKWKRGRLDGLRHVTDLCGAYYARVVVIHIHRSPEAWRRFYEQAAVFVAEAHKRTGEVMPYLDGTEVLRMSLFGTAFAEATGRLLGSRMPWGDRDAVIAVDLVVDSDLKEGESRKQFLWMLEQWTRRTGLPEELRVKPSLRGHVHTEQEEPLLLLPDYMAGVHQHADPRASLAAPVVTQSEASSAVEAIRERLGQRLYEVTREFVDEYPLEHRAGRVAQRGDPPGNAGP